MYCRIHKQYTYTRSTLVGTVHCLKHSHGKSTAPYQSDTWGCIFFDTSRIIRLVSNFWSIVDSFQASLRIDRSQPSRNHCAPLHYYTLTRARTQACILTLANFSSRTTLSQSYLQCLRKQVTKRRHCTPSCQPTGQQISTRATRRQQLSQTLTIRTCRYVLAQSKRVCVYMFLM